MAKSCNLRYQYLKQLESEFASMAGSDESRRHELATEIVALHMEFGSRDPECEHWLKRGDNE